MTETNKNVDNCPRFIKLVWKMFILITLNRGEGHVKHISRYLKGGEGAHLYQIVIYNSNEMIPLPRIITKTAC